MDRRSLLALDWYILTHYWLSTERRPFLASYKLTYRCNLRCQQCPFTMLQSPDPTFSQVCQTLDNLYARGSRVVIFEGGEPFLWRDGEHTLRDVVKYARRNFACVGITTNGTLLLDAEPDILWVSLDGFAATHDRLRGAPIFGRVMENISRSNHPRLYGHITANRENAAEIPGLIRSLKGIVRGITIQFYYPYDTEDRWYLGGQARGDLLEEIIQLKRREYPVLNSPAALRAIKTGDWHCRHWLVDCANPDGSLSQGCYLQGRARIDCTKCGFTPYTEISLAFGGNLQAIRAGMKIFF